MIRTKLVLARFDSSGRIVEKRENDSRSWVKHFFDLWYGNLIKTNLANIADINGNLRTLQHSDGGRPIPNLQINGPPGGTGMALTTVSGLEWDTYSISAVQAGENIGIVVGTNNAPVSPADNALGTRIAHGKAIGQLLYGGCELFGLTFVNPNGQFTIRRYFTNVLGGAIGVQEIGIYSPGMSTTSLTCYTFCIARDVVAPVVTVNNGEILSASYVVQITV